MHEDEKEIIETAIKNGFGKDWFYRSDICGVHLISEDGYEWGQFVILKIYQMELDDHLYVAVPLSEFSVLWKDENIG